MIISKGYSLDEKDKIGNVYNNEYGLNLKDPKIKLNSYFKLK